MSDWDLRALLAIYGGADGAFGPLMVALTVLGGGWAAVGLVALMAASRTRRFGIALTLAVITQAAIVWLLKVAFGRVRPWIALGLTPPFGAPRDGSFPSGHASGSFCVAAFLSIALPGLAPGNLRGSRGLRALPILLAAGVAISRVYLGAHFPSDVLAGALLGALVGVCAGKSFTKSAWQRPASCHESGTAARKKLNVLSLCGSRPTSPRGLRSASRSPRAQGAVTRARAAPITAPPRTGCPQQTPTAPKSSYRASTRAR